MIRSILCGAALLGAISVAGCSSSNGVWPFTSNNASDAELAAYAASANYPAEVKPTSDRDVAAVVDPGHSMIHIFNFSDQPLSQVNVWVNGTYVVHILSIPPKGSIALRESDFYNREGQRLSTQKSTPTKVEIEQGNNLYEAQGPVSE